MRVARTFAVAAAILLVSAVALGTLAGDGMTLGGGLLAADFQLAAMERFVRLHMSGWLWDHPLKALLGRPVWLLPAAFGIIFAGASATAASQGNAMNSRHRRS